MRKTFCRCSCFLTSNIYLEQIGVHVHYTNDEQFRQDYQHLQSSKNDENYIDQLLKLVHNEMDRRRTLDVDARKRKDQISRQYQPLHPELYQFHADYLSDHFKRLCLQPVITHESISNLGNGIYSMPVFTKDFCTRLIAELKYFEASPMPKGRPNSMNNYGVLLDELGFTNFIDEFRNQYLNPLVRALYSDQYVGNTGLDSHKAFVVTYKIGQDIDLGYHYDNAEITLNVSLGDQFEGGALYFGPMAQTNPTSIPNFTFVEHKPTTGILHRGQHLHGTEPIDSGERYNLIIWMRSSSIRNQLCLMCWQKPTCLIPVEADSYGDGMTCSSESD